MRNLADIAQEIKSDWGKVHFGAVPYLQAMLNMSTVYDKYGNDSAKEIVLYFLSNASTYRTPKAKQLKSELRELIR